MSAEDLEIQLEEAQEDVRSLEERVEELKVENRLLEDRIEELEGVLSDIYDDIRGVL